MIRLRPATRSLCKLRVVANRVAQASRNDSIVSVRTDAMSAAAGHGRVERELADGILRAARNQRRLRHYTDGIVTPAADCRRGSVGGDVVVVATRHCRMGRIRGYVIISAATDNGEIRRGNCVILTTERCCPNTGHAVVRIEEPGRGDALLVGQRPRHRIAGLGDEPGRPATAQTVGHHRESHRREPLARRQGGAIHGHLYPHLRIRQRAGEIARVGLIADECRIESINDSHRVGVLVLCRAATRRVIQPQRQPDAAVDQVRAVEQPALIIDELRHIRITPQSREQRGQTNDQLPHDFSPSLFLATPDPQHSNHRKQWSGAVPPPVFLLRWRDSAAPQSSNDWKSPSRFFPMIGKRGSWMMCRICFYGVTASPPSPSFLAMAGMPPFHKRYCASTVSVASGSRPDVRL